MRTLAAIAACLALLGCASPASGPINPGPYPNNYEKIVQNWLRASLKDPYSVRDLRIERPVADRFFVGLLNGGYVDAYQTCVTYNAKNSYGAYVGIRDYRFLLKNGAVLNGPAGEFVWKGCSR